MSFLPIDPDPRENYPTRGQLRSEMQQRMADAHAAIEAGLSDLGELAWQDVGAIKTADETSVLHAEKRARQIAAQADGLAWRAA